LTEYVRRRKPWQPAINITLSKRGFFLKTWFLVFCKLNNLDCRREELARFMNQGRGDLPDSDE
jgi:hypothetical protein